MAIQALSNIKAKVTISQGENYLFPEQTDEFLKRTTNNGVCFSGGGTRSLAATIGQLRALHALGLIKNIRYISCVSGGSWASAAFTYYRAGPKNDEEFLGADVSASERKTWPFTDPNGPSWQTLADNSLGHTATQSLKDALEHFLTHGPWDEAWQQAVGTIYFKPFGLYDPANPKFFSLSEKTVQEILQHNQASQPQWTAEDFDIAQADRPFLIINGCLIWPTSIFHTINKVLFQFTPLYVGNPYLLPIEENHIIGSTTRQIGGGFVEPFAFQSTGPTSAPAIGPPGTGLVDIPASPNPFTLWQASGISSSAYAADTARIDPELLPQATYWPAGLAGQSPAHRYRFGDGGNLENYGLMALLQRRVEHIVVFVNSEQPIEKTGENEYKADVYLAPLFGYTTNQFPNNTVFPQREYQTLVQNLYEAQQQGGLALARGCYQVQPNTWYGIERYEVNVLWVYNTLVANWVKELNESVRSLVLQGVNGSGPLKDFPNYKTAFENSGDLVELTPQQVNLLADMFSWSIQQQPDLFKTWLAAPSRA